MDVLHPQLRCHHEVHRSWPVPVWKSAQRLQTIASAPLGGGLGLGRWVADLEVPSSASFGDRRCMSGARLARERHAAVRSGIPRRPFP
ncbi:MAG: hypothetical protein KY447_11445 [Actinobacteria bacterium]|nr:hypothetical protein [Actinomycetota bacterium]MBW3643517.1 hypothetical protein [Actinomycetota bacterium]